MTTPLMGARGAVRPTWRQRVRTALEVIPWVLFGPVCLSCHERHDEAFFCFDGRWDGRGQLEATWRLFVETQCAYLSRLPSGIGPRGQPYFTSYNLLTHMQEYIPGYVTVGTTGALPDEAAWTASHAPFTQVTYHGGRVR